MSESRARAPPPLILVADDDASSRLLVRLALEQSDFDVVEAATGVEAVAAFTEHGPELILMDVVMPGMDGYQACSTIRLLPGGSIVPVLMLTGLDDVDSIRKAFDAGATDFVTQAHELGDPEPARLYMLRASSAMLELKESETVLENAQRIARLGHWQEDVERSDVRWSKEMYRVFGVDAQSFEPQINASVVSIHPDDRDDLLRRGKRSWPVSGTASSTSCGPPRRRVRHVTCRCSSQGRGGGATR
jgi:CheY-like chemotaxis protein